MKNHQLACQANAIRRTLMAALTIVTATISLAAVAETKLGVPSGAYGLDKGHGYITFTYSHLGFSNPHVGFDDFDVDLKLNADDPAASTLAVVIQAGSIASRVDEFDKHLRSGDYFDTEKHPTIEFASSAVRMTSATTAEIDGDLTIKGVTKPVTLKTTLNKAGNHPIARRPTLGVSAKTTIQRSQWGLDKYVPLVGDDVDIEIEVELPQSQ